MTGWISVNGAFGIGFVRIDEDHFQYTPAGSDPGANIGAGPSIAQTITFIAQLKSLIEDYQQVNR